MKFPLTFAARSFGGLWSYRRGTHVRVQVPAAVPVAVHVRNQGQPPPEAPYGMVGYLPFTMPGPEE